MLKMCFFTVPSENQSRCWSGDDFDAILSFLIECAPADGMVTVQLTLVNGLGERFHSLLQEVLLRSPGCKDLGDGGGQHRIKIALEARMVGHGRRGHEGAQRGVPCGRGGRGDEGVVGGGRVPADDDGVELRVLDLLADVDALDARGREDGFDGRVEGCGWGG